MKAVKSAMQSWKTSLGGLLMAVGAALQTAGVEMGTPWMSIAGGILLAAAGFFTGLSARDNDKSRDNDKNTTEIFPLHRLRE